MYAIIQTGGRQYKVSEGICLNVEKINGEVGSELTISDVLMLGGDTVTVGQPNVNGASISATIEEQGRGDKVLVHKFIRRKNSQKLNGHRQPYTRLKINKINH